MVKTLRSFVCVLDSQGAIRALRSPNSKMVRECLRKQNNLKKEKEQQSHPPVGTRTCELGGYGNEEADKLVRNEVL